MTVLRIAAAAGGAALVVVTLLSALKTVVVPRGYVSRISRTHFLVLRWLFERWVRPSRPYAERDRALAFYAPLALVSLPAVWVSLITVGFTGIFWATGIHPLAEAFATSGSSLFTLGFDRPPGSGRVALSFAEAGIGLGLVSLMISYLPTIYGAFSRREALVGMLEVRAGLPPSPSELIVRYTTIGWLPHLSSDLFTRWEEWFVDVEESHTSHPSLVFFRSPHPERSWITAAGCVLDTAALMASAVDLPRDPQVDVMLRTGFFSLRRVADYFGIRYDADPQPTDAVSVDREEFVDVCGELRAAGVPLVDDLDRAWADFQGWRVNYDAVLVGLCTLVVAPPARWSSDRGRLDQSTVRAFRTWRRTPRG